MNEAPIGNIGRMSTNPSWLTVTFTPGLSPIHHGCIAEIALGGHLSQRLVERRGGGWFPIKPEYETQLDASQLEMLQGVVASIDFERLASRLRLTSICDANCLAIEWHPPDAPSKKVDGPILRYGRGYHDFKQTFEPAQRLWKLVYSFLPHKFTNRF